MNNLNIGGIKVYFDKIKLNSLFLNSKYIIYMNWYYNVELKHKILSYDVCNMILKKKYINNVFNSLNFSFLKNNLLCIFVNDSLLFINIIKILDNKEFFYSYKNSFSNITTNQIIIEEYKKYNNNLIYIHLLLKKIIIKIIFLLLFFLITIIKFIK